MISPRQTTALESGAHPGGWPVRHLFALLLTSLAALITLPLLLLKALHEILPLTEDTYWGVCYRHLVTALLFAAILLVWHLSYRLRKRIWLAVLTLAAGLFCAAPFLLALRQKPTLSQLLLCQPAFANWPAYLQPLHLLVAVVLPLTILAFLVLALKELLGPEKRGYASLGLALFLGLAVYIGGSELKQSGQTTWLFRLPAREMAKDKDTPAPPPPLASVAVSEKIAATPVAVGEKPTDGPPASQGAEMESRFLALEERLERLQARVDLLESHSTPPVAAAAAAQPVSAASGEGRSDARVLDTILHQLENLTSKVDQITGTR